MCGIVGYIGNAPKALNVVLDGLTALEYRGYDSAGVAYLNQDQQLQLERQVGRVQGLINGLGDQTPAVSSAIGHTRWATHGIPTILNAHPQKNTAGSVMVVHNGIIENYQELRAHLQNQGYAFTSETDTEVIPQLIDFFLRSNDSFSAAFEQALSQLRGAFAIVAITSQDPDTLYAARLSSPLVLGIGESELIIASDPAAILEHTKQVVYLEDYEYARLSRDGSYQITNFKDAKPVNHEIETLEYDAAQTLLGDYPHFMLKEINEIPATIQAAIRGRVKPESNTVKLGGLETVEEQLKYIDRIVIVACGTASYAGLYGEYLIEELAGIPVEVQQASEFKYRTEPFSRSTVVIAVSQSGETADTIAALKKVEDYGVLRLGVINAVGSTMTRMTDAGVYCHAGPEQAVASTKAFFAQSIVLLLIGLHLSNGQSDLYKPLLAELESLPAKAKLVLDQAPAIKRLAEKYQSYKNFMYIGRGYAYPCALEGALKHKECALVHSEGYPAGELKHGPLALIDQDFPTFAIATNSSILDKTLGSIEEIRARKGPIIAIATEGNSEVSRVADDIIYIPASLEQTAPLLAEIVLQLFSYYVAVAKGLDVDRPRNLAKSVTVE